MKKHAPNIAILSIIIVTTAIVILFYISEENAKEHISDWLATSPVHSLYKAQNALNRNHYDQAQEALDKAILELQSIERYSDETVNKYINNTIEDLITIEDELIDGKLNLDDLNLVFFEAMNAVAYADLKIAEQDLKEEKKYKAVYLLKSSVLILKRSLLYTNDSVKKKENKIIYQLSGVLDSLKSSPDFNFYGFSEINDEIEEILDHNHLN